LNDASNVPCSFCSGADRNTGSGGLRPRTTGLATEKRLTIRRGETNILKRMILLFFVAALGFVPALAAERPTNVVHAFTLASGVNWPYNMNEMQAGAVAAIKARDGDLFDVMADAPASQIRFYTLDGEVLAWHKGNTAERMLIAAGSVAGRENAKIHYWLTDKDGKKVFDHTDTIRQVWMENGHERSSGMLAKPFGEKVADRLKEAKLVAEVASAQ